MPQGKLSRRDWTAAEDARLTEAWGKVRTWILAKELQRTPSALKQRAIRLKLDAEKQYTEEQKELVRKLYPTHTAAQIAEKVFGSRRSALAIYRLAQLMGLRKWPQMDPEKVAMIPKLHAKGLTDQAISERTGIERRYVSELRRDKFGLPVNVEAVKEAGRRAVKSQMKTLGIDSPTQLRTRAFRLYAIENGWPEDFLPREVQILNALATFGPMTAEQIAEKIGMRADRRNSVHGGKKLLDGCNRKKANGIAAGTYTASLIDRGLIVYILRTKGSMRYGGRQPGLYTLTAAAIEIINQRLAKGA